MQFFLQLTRDMGDVLFFRSCIRILTVSIIVLSGFNSPVVQAWSSNELLSLEEIALPPTSKFDTQTDITPLETLATTGVETVLTNSVFGLAINTGQPRHRTVAPDKWEKLNRFTFKLNDRTDKLFFKPLAKGYRAVTTKWMRKALRNVLSNLNTPVVLVNDLLQGEFERGKQTIDRFLVNSTIGIGGLRDPATKLGIPRHDEDFGQTLATWGVPSGPYVVLPLFGPSTLRDSFGLGIDGFLFSPLNYIRTGAAQKARLSRSAATLLSQREPLIEPLEDIERNSLDYYSSFRSFYLQARRREILNGQSSLEDLPDIGDGFDDFDEFDDFDDGITDDSVVSPVDEVSEETSP